MPSIPGSSTSRTSAPLKRISIVGSPGSGKTTLARALAERLGHDHVELDALHHLPGWTQRPRGELRSLVSARLEAPRWVVDGNYDNAVQDLVWQAADTVVWLDLPRATVMRSVIWRTVSRGVLRTELWNGNRERLLNLFARAPEDNIALWTWTRFAAYRSRYQAACVDPSWSHLSFVRLGSREEVRRWLDGACTVVAT